MSAKRLAGKKYTIEVKVTDENGLVVANQSGVASDFEIHVDHNHVCQCCLQPWPDGCGCRSMFDIQNDDPELGVKHSSTTLRLVAQLEGEGKA